MTQLLTSKLPGVLFAVFMGKKGTVHKTAHISR